MCPICEKKHIVECHETEYPQYTNLEDSYLHSKIICDFCNQEMVLLYNKDLRTLKAANEKWLLDLKAYSSFSKLMKTIINDMEQEISRNRSFQMRFELIQLKEVSDRMQKRHSKIQKKYKKQKLEWRNSLLTDELKSIKKTS